MEDLELHAYTERLASAAPTPGGGSAAAIVGALGAALCSMVARITAEGKIDDDRKRECETVAEEADTLRRVLLVERALDEAAYASVVAATALPRATDADKAARTEAVQDALQTAAGVPLGSGRRATAIAALAETLLTLGSKNLISDVLCAGEFAAASLAASGANVRINHKYLKDRILVATQAGELAELERSVALHLERIRAYVATALEPPPSA